MARILLIEPNILLAQIFVRALEHGGHQVVHRLSAQAGIDAADQLVPDVVILELQLPMHGGVEFLHEFRSYAEWQQVPVIVHTTVPPSMISKVHPVLAKEFGVVDVLYKPQTSLEQLVRSVSEQLVSA